ncbi:MAG TPA: PAM68 family protein [Leptolyngbyaceae cyanobacterium M65_K2018_010]|nr:PAM68 family protein [Leptolyngbyaceae cyanobacterium M65_K2018_010]
MASDSPRKRLPFEPSGKGKGKDSTAKSARTAPPAVPSAQAAKPKVAASKSVQPNQAGTAKSARSIAPPPPQGQSPSAATPIPEVVSRRMLRRMLVFSGTPTLFGVLVFFVSYFLVVKAGLELPPYAVLFTTLGCFGLGVAGLTCRSWRESGAEVDAILHEVAGLPRACCLPSGMRSGLAVGWGSRSSR